MADFLCVLIEDFFPLRFVREREKATLKLCQKIKIPFFSMVYKSWGKKKKKKRIKTRHETAILVMFLAGNN